MTDDRAPRLLFINYHYIRDTQYRYPGIHALPIPAFKDQVEWLRGRFHFATPDQVESFLLDGKGLPGPSVFLTFDDGLVDHWQAAREVLDPLDIRAGFFVCSRPAIEGRVLSVHKIHWLRAQTAPDEFASEFYSHVPRHLQPAPDEPWFESARRTYVYDSEIAARLKYALNFVLPSDIVDSVTSEMLAKRGIDEREFCSRTYMGEGDLRTLRTRGHVLGVHGHTHEPFSRLGEALYDEIRVNRDFLARAGGETPRWVSYPYGRKDAIPAPDALERLFSEFGFRLGFTLLGGWNAGMQDCRRLFRINTNDVAALVDSPV